MQFDELVSVLLENFKEQSILFVEDDLLRMELIRKSLAKYNPTAKYLIIDNNEDAIYIIKKHYNDITDYSLDYNLKMETTEPVANVLKSLGNDGANVWIHSDMEEGCNRLKSILPKAKIKQVPSNIVSMIPDENL